MVVLIILAIVFFAMAIGSILIAIHSKDADLSNFCVLFTGISLAASIILLSSYVVFGLEETERYSISNYNSIKFSSRDYKIDYEINKSDTTYVLIKK